MKKLKRNQVIALISLGAIAVIGCSIALVSLRNTDRELMAAPPLKAGAASAEAHTTYITIPIRLDEKSITEIANSAVPKSTVIPNTEEAADRMDSPVPFSSARWTIWAINTSGGLERGPIVVKAKDGGLEAKSRISGQMTARLSGRVPDARETATAVADINARLVVDIDKDWSAAVAVSPIPGQQKMYSWVDRPSARLFNMIPLSLGGVAERALDRKIGDLNSTLPTMVNDQLKLKDVMSGVWKDAHRVIQVSKGPAAWLTVDPVSVHLAPPTTDQGALILNFGLASNIALSSTLPQAPVPETLPALEKTLPPSGFQVAIPVQAAYGDLAGALSKALKDKKLSVDTGKGLAIIVIEDLKIYPSAPRLVIGAKIDADLPNQFLDTRGWIYIYATPTYDAIKRTMVLSNIDFARVLDNRLTSVLTAAFRNALSKELQKIARIDLSKPMEEATGKANTFLSAGLETAIRNSKKEGSEDALSVVLSQIDVEGLVDNVKSVSFSLTDKNLTVVPVLTGNLAVTIQPLATVNVNNTEGGKLSAVTPKNENAAK